MCHEHWIIVASGRGCLEPNRVPSSSPWTTELHDGRLLLPLPHNDAVSSRLLLVVWAFVVHLREGR